MSGNADLGNVMGQKEISGGTGAKYPQGEADRLTTERCQDKGSANKPVIEGQEQDTPKGQQVK